MEAPLLHFPEVGFNFEHPRVISRVSIRLPHSNSRISGCWEKEIGFPYQRFHGVDQPGDNHRSFRRQLLEAGRAIWFFCITDKDCIKVLQKKFPESKRVGKLEAMLLEAKGSWEEAEKAYSSLLEDNPCDQVVHKRRVAIAKAQGNILGAIEWLNKYLEIFMADHDAWRELAEVYVSLQMYKQAAFCYEELILLQPTVPLYHLAYADVLYTLGGLENLQAAKKYYASTIDLTGGKNTRALFGICMCTSVIAQQTKGRSKEDKDSPDLQSLAARALEKEYKQRAPDKLSMLTSALKSFKFS